MLQLLQLELVRQKEERLILKKMQKVQQSLKELQVLRTRTLRNQ
jgi:hypothetical protein